jgi:hypothetical protein
LLQLALQRVPAARDLFRLTSPSIGNQLIPMLAGLIPISVLELAKLIPRWLLRLPVNRCRLRH